MVRGHLWFQGAMLVHEMMMVTSIYSIQTITGNHSFQNSRSDVPESGVAVLIFKET